MEITSKEIDKFVSHGHPAHIFHPEVVVYSEHDLRASIFNAMNYVKETLAKECKESLTVRKEKKSISEFVEDV